MQQIRRAVDLSLSSPYVMNMADYDPKWDQWFRDLRKRQERENAEYLKREEREAEQPAARKIIPVTVPPDCPDKAA
jgi:hypothetical protein